ncbi:MAG: type II toxin-antitoxin system HicB family antitoxin [Alphaproteobacteria bacterium]|nr:type II toxin-antitoxin system HicB family antitoxin [Alphaproteobacteria bacterium]MBM3640207.1 type II toxin-antitoxin system HicB family antitoxin [Alphaproteobacteria bacterium]
MRTSASQGSAKIGATPSASTPPEEGGYYILSYPEIPGCLGVGDTEAEAVEDGRRALVAVLDALKAVDRPPPEPRGEESV